MMSLRSQASYRRCIWEEEQDTSARKEGKQVWSANSGCIEFLFLKNRLGAFSEVVPLMDFKPDTEFDMEFGLGIRFFF
jgi:hypothetical protein